MLADPAFGALNVWYTTGANTCPAAAPDPADDGGSEPNLLFPDLDWVEWPDGTDLPVAPDAVTGLQVELLPANHPFQPGDTVDVDFHMTAPPYLADADYTAPQGQPDLQAYNTVGTSGRFITQSQALRYTLPSEPPNVGVALANGPLAVEKLVTGDASKYAPTSFPATLSCVSVGVDVPFTPDVANLTLVPGVPQTIHNLPWGATCTVTEEGDQGR